VDDHVEVMHVDGNAYRLLVLRINGIMRRTEFEESQRAAAKMIREIGKLTALVLLDGFQGWERTEEWGDVSFLMEHDSDVAKIAIVGPEKWREEVLVFAGVGIRRSRVRYFSDSGSARAWLADKPAPDATPPG
jgi:SpoIIAA-like